MENTVLGSGAGPVSAKGGAHADAGRLFRGSCVALVATSMAFAVVTAIMLDLKSEFGLSNFEVGLIAGAATWGFAVSQLVFAPLCDPLGMRFLVRLAFLCHLVGAAFLLTGLNFWTLFAGALVLALANGLVEAACNPLVAALYPDQKTVRLNQFHVWFPGGIVIGGLLSYGLGEVGLTEWRLKVALLFIPTLVYGAMILRRTFPPTEGVRQGVSMGEMFRATLTTPLMLLLLVCMAVTASTELGPGRWVTPVLEAGGLPGILVLVWINGIMAVLRYKAGFAVKRLSPPGVLAASSAVAFVGLFWLSYAESLATALMSATVFAIGVCYFWPTMLGYVSEHVPKSGALGLGLMGAVGMAVVGLVTTPEMGRIADRVGHDQLPVAETAALLADAADQLPAAATAPTGAVAAEAGSGGQDQDAAGAGDAARAALASYEETGELPVMVTAAALRSIQAASPASELAGRAGAVLGPADNYGGRVSFRYLLPFTGALIVVFGLLYVRTRAAPGVAPS